MSLEMLRIKKEHHTQHNGSQCTNHSLRVIGRMFIMTLWSNCFDYLSTTQFCLDAHYWTHKLRLDQINPLFSNRPIKDLETVTTIIDLGQLVKMYPSKWYGSFNPTPSHSTIYVKVFVAHPKIKSPFKQQRQL